MDFHKVAAELLGSFLFLSIGYLSVAAFGAAGATGLLVVPFSFGLGLLAAIFAFGHVSGGHFNPAVTVAMVLDRRTTPVNAVGYILSQAVGALAAGLLVLVAVGQQAVANGITKPNAAAGVTDGGALLIETVMTAGFVAVILARRVPTLAALAIPFSLVAIHFGTASLTGASVNPARSLGSALIGGDVSALWIYIVAPVAGAVLGWLVWKVFDAGSPAEPAA